MSGQMDFIQNQIGSWGDRTFPSHRERVGAGGTLYHLREEVDELITALESGDQEEVRKEMADCAILLFMAAHLFGFSLSKAVWDKHEINLARKWLPPDENGVCRHVKEEVAA